MTSKKFILFTAGILYFSTHTDAQQTYTVQGIVFNSSSNQPIKNAQVWIYGKQIGDITDSLGHYKFNVFQSYSDTRMYVRVCGDEIATSKLVSFGADTLIQTVFYLNRIDNICPSPPNIPWKVSPSEYVNYEGYVILDMHGDFFKTCSDNTYSPVWPEDFKRTEFWSDDSQFGDSLFIQLKGRLDPFSKDVVPAQNLYIGEIVTIRASKSQDCESK